MENLIIAEIPFETGEIKFRYSRYLSPDGTKWIRHGLFQQFHKNGQLASEGNYENGIELGTWTDYHDNGQKTAEGTYTHGEQNNDWMLG